MTAPDAPNEADESRVLLQTYLAGRNVACPHCEYNLRDLRSDVCPECGERVVLRIALVEPKLAAVISGIVALAAGAGLNGLLLIYMLIMIMFRGEHMRGFMQTFGAVNAGGLLVEGTALAFWILRRRAILRSSPQTRWLLVSGCCILTLADVVVFAILIK